MAKNIFLAILSAVTLVVAAAAHGSAAEVTLRVGYATSTTGPHAAGARAFEEEIERLAPGQFQVEHFPGGSLGGERAMVEGVQLGSLEMAVVGSAVIGNFVPKMMVADLPFLFTDYAHARAVLDGPIGEELLQEFRTSGLIGLAFGEIGFRHLTNSRRPIESVEDLQGLKIRTMENPVHIDAFRELGALPTPMAWTEVLTGLQQGTVDGQENPMSVIRSTKLWEMQDHVTLSRHVFTPVAFVVAPSLFDSLSAENQDNLRQAAQAGAQAMRRYVDDMEESGTEELRSHGMQVVTDIDTSQFQVLMEPIYEQYGSRFGDLVERIRSQGNNAAN